jgi:Protein of unknown function (DUF2752)
MQLEERLTIAAQGISGRIMAGAAVVGIVGGSAMVAAFDPTGEHFFPVCPLYQLTGLACPGCGLTRGFHALFHGDLSAALGFNLLLPVWAVILAYAWVSLVVYAVRGKGLPMWPTHPRFLSTFFAVLIVFGVLRNIPAYPFTLLFP